MDRAQLLAQIAADITTNGDGAITGSVLNTVLTNMVNSLASLADSNAWGAAQDIPGVEQHVTIAGINANSVADTTFAIALPTGFSKYAITSVRALNPSVSLTAAFAAVYSGASATGLTLVSATALSGLTTNAAGTSGNGVVLAMASGASAIFLTGADVYFRITTAQGGVATLDVSIGYLPIE